MRLLTKNEIITLSVIIITVIVAIAVMILLMCRLKRGQSIQRFVEQQTPSAHGRADVIRICSVDYVESPMNLRLTDSKYKENIECMYFSKFA